MKSICSSCGLAAKTPLENSINLESDRPIRILGSNVFAELTSDIPHPMSFRCIVGPVASSTPIRTYLLPALCVPFPLPCKKRQSKLCSQMTRCLVPAARYSLVCLWRKNGCQCIDRRQQRSQFDANVSH